MGIIVFNNRSSREFGLEVESPPSYEAPEKNYETFEVPGRNGDIQIDQHSFKNVNRTYDVSFDARRQGFSRTASMIMGWLRSASGYARLEDSYDEDYYREACFKQSSEIENIFNEAGKLTIEFECKPQRWLKSGEQAVDAEDGQTLINPTLFTADPSIVIYSTVINEIVVSIGADAITVSADRAAIYESAEGTMLNEAITIDCMNHFVTAKADFQVDDDIFIYRANCNAYVTGDWPQLVPGENVYNGPTAKIIPRWWTI